MLLRLFLLIIVLGALFYFFNYYKHQSANKRKETLMRALIYFVSGLLIVLVLTGRISWIFALLGAALPWLNRLAMAHQLWNTFKKQNNQHQNDQQQNNQNSGQHENNNKMTLQRAYEILGIDESADRAQVLAAHRRQILNNHPDRGGSDYLAKQINLARDIILAHIKK